MNRVVFKQTYKDTRVKRCVYKQNDFILFFDLNFAWVWGVQSFFKFQARYRLRLSNRQSHYSGKM